jgi:hypothetical protein
MHNKLRFYQYKKHFRNGGAFFLIVFRRKIVESCRTGKDMIFISGFAFVFKNSDKTD